MVRLPNAVTKHKHLAPLTAKAVPGGTTPKEDITKGGWQPTQISSAATSQPHPSLNPSSPNGPGGESRGAYGASGHKSHSGP